ncbi:hypothetical protein O3G_MSEX004856, partial [Manduca sexta]
MSTFAFFVLCAQACVIS